MLTRSRSTQQCAQTLASGEPLVASATLTIPRLCPNTEYGIRLILTDAAGQQSMYEWFGPVGINLDVLGIVPQWNLVGRTAPEPVPADFLLRLVALDRLGAWHHQLRDGHLGSHRAGGQRDVGRSDRRTRLVHRDRLPPPTAAGFGSATALGQLRLYVSYTLTTPGWGELYGTSTTVSFVVDTTAVWDGRSEQTFSLHTADGSEVFLTLHARERRLHPARRSAPRRGGHRCGSQRFDVVSRCARES